MVFDDKFEVINHNTQVNRNNSKQYKISGDNSFIKEETINEWFSIEYATTTIKEYNDFNTRQLDKQSNAIFKFINPVHAQTYYAGAGDGSVAYDNANWDTVHDASTGSYAGPTESYKFCESKHTGGVYWIRRCFFPFDTSGLSYDPLTEEISTSSLFVYAKAKTNTDDDAYNYLRVVETSQASNITLTTADYDQAGTTDNPTGLADDLDFDDITASSYMEFELNATGILAIDDTGYTLLGLREGHDVEDVAIDTGTESSIDVYFSEQTGSAEDPYLIINIEDISTSTEEETASSTQSLPCDLEYNNNINMIVGCTEIYTDSTTTPSETRYQYYYIPFILWIVIIVPFIWVASRLLIEWVIRLRN